MRIADKILDRCRPETYGPSDGRRIDGELWLRSWLISTNTVVSTTSLPAPSLRMSCTLRHIRFAYPGFEKQNHPGRRKAGNGSRFSHYTKFGNDCRALAATAVVVLDRTTVEVVDAGKILKNTRTLFAFRRQRPEPYFGYGKVKDRNTMTAWERLECRSSSFG